MRHIILLTILSLTLTMQAQVPIDTLNHFLQRYQFKEALLWLDKQEKTKENLFQKAMCYKSLGENKKTIEILKSLSESYPDDLNIKIELAQAYDRASKWKDASASYADIVAMDSTNLYFTIKKSEADINHKNYTKAIQNLELSLQKDTLMNAVRLLGKSYESINRLDSAMHYYHLAWSADSTDVFAAANLVNTALKAKYYLQAKAFSESYVKKDSTDKQMNMLYGYSLYALEDYEAAIPVLSKCYQAGDSSLVVTRSLGMSLYYEGKSDSSYIFLKKAYDMDTTNSTVLYNLAVSARDIKRYDESAIHHSTILNRLIPSDMQLYLNYRGLAISQECTELYSEAAENYSKALKYANENQKIDILYPLARIWDEELKHNNMALVYYRQYRVHLEEYTKFYKKEDPNGEKYKEFSNKLKELQAYLSILERKQEEDRGKESAEIEKKEETTKPWEDRFLFVVDGVVVDKHNKQTEKPLYQKIIYDFDYIGLSEEELKYVELAKEKGKEMIVIVVFDPK